LFIERLPLFTISAKRRQLAYRMLSQSSKAWLCLKRAIVEVMKNTWKLPMSTMNFIGVIERYHDHKNSIQDLLASIITGIAEEPVYHDKQTQCKAMKCLVANYPFVDLLYVLDKNGVQISDNIAASSKSSLAYHGKGKDRSQRPYYIQAQNCNEIVVTEHYFSPASRKLSISASIRRTYVEGEEEYLVLDCDLAAIIEFLMGDAARRRFQPYFKSIYALIVTGLFLVVGLLLYSAASELFSLVSTESGAHALHLKPFGVVIFLTLALAIFDLGKTTLEEEVLMHKDIFRHSSTRRTITRFIAAILIAVSIEALLLMFKAALGESQYLANATWMMLAAIGLLIALGIYVYLGAKAERILLRNFVPK